MSNEEARRDMTGVQVCVVVVSASPQRTEGGKGKAAMTQIAPALIGQAGACRRSLSLSITHSTACGRDLRWRRRRRTGDQPLTTPPIVALCPQHAAYPIVIDISIPQHLCRNPSLTMPRLHTLLYSFHRLLYPSSYRLRRTTTTASLILYLRASRSSKPTQVTVTLVPAATYANSHRSLAHPPQFMFLIIRWYSQSSKKHQR